MSIRTGAATFASLTNVALALKLMDNLKHRPANGPSMAALCGPSGYGKTKALCVVANRERGYYVECRSFDNRKSFLLSVLADMGISVPKRATIPDLAQMVAAELMDSGRPLLIDQVDYLLERGLVELVRDIHDMSQAAILLVGEEGFPKAIKKASERFDNRILYWQLAEKCSLEDARKLVKLCAPKVPFADDWLAACIEGVAGITRRVNSQIENARRESEESGVREVNLKWWGSRPWMNGEPPKRAP